jgi:hypothetical protein
MKKDDFFDKSEEQNVSLDSLIQGDTLTEGSYVNMFGDKDTPMFDGVVQTSENENKNNVNGISTNTTDAYEDIENKKRFIRNLNPEYKANAVYSVMIKNPKQYPNVPQVGHAKRIFMRKLIRDAKKGKLDRFFLQ